MTTGRLWIVAVVVLAVAVGLFAFGRSRSGGGDGGDARGVVEDGAGDVAGQAPPEVEARIDVRRASLARTDGDLALVIELQDELDRDALDAEPLTVAATLRSGKVTYEVRASIGTAVAQAAVTDVAQLDRPFTLPAPSVRGRALRLAIPDDAVPTLDGSFAWGIAVRLGGSEDVAPADRSALFPPLEGAGIGPSRSNR